MRGESPARRAADGANDDARASAELVRMLVARIKTSSGAKEECSWPAVLQAHTA